MLNPMSEEFNLEQLVRTAILAARKVRRDHVFMHWSDRWLQGIDRTFLASQEISGSRTVATFAAAAAGTYDRYLIETKPDFKKAHARAAQIQATNALDIFVKDRSQNELDEIKNFVRENPDHEIWRLAEELKTALLRFQGGLNEFSGAGTALSIANASEAAQNALQGVNDFLLAERGKL